MKSPCPGRYDGVGIELLNISLLYQLTGVLGEYCSNSTSALQNSSKKLKQMPIIESLVFQPKVSCWHGGMKIRRLGMLTLSVSPFPHSSVFTWNLKTILSDVFNTLNVADP